MSDSLTPLAAAMLPGAAGQFIVRSDAKAPAEPMTSEG